MSELAEQIGRFLAELERQSMSVHTLRARARVGHGSHPVPNSYREL
jgi:hypothetical protein